MAASADNLAHVAVVVPCFNVERHVGDVVASIPAFVETIILVDDHSTDGTRARIEELEDERIVRIHHERNLGVGGAVQSGYTAALEHGAEICVKMDGDGQMAGEQLPRLVAPLMRGVADYTKANRFWDIEALAAMPRVRMLGNGVLSFLTKLVSGYWSIFDPTNGYTAIRSPTLRKIRGGRLHARYFFETSMLIELNIIGAAVHDVDMPARYGDEKSSLNVRSVLLTFPWLLCRGLLRRFFARYMLRDFNAVTMCILWGLPVFLFGVLFGAYNWWDSLVTGELATPGTTILAALPILLGTQLFLMALVLDILHEPRTPLARAEAEEREALECMGDYRMSREKSHD